MLDPTLFFISNLFETDYYAILVLLTFLALAFSKYRTQLIIALLVVILLLPVLKSFYREDRPCIGSISPVDCINFEFKSDKYGFPSGHAATSIILPIATLGTYAFFLFLPLSFLIAFSRIYLGVHTLNQVAGGISLGLAVFFLVERIHEFLQGLRKKKTAAIRRASALSEGGRQLIHVIGGFVVIGMLFWFGLYVSEMITIVFLIWGLLLINMKQVGMKLGPFEYFLDKFERNEGRFAGFGSLLYVIGILLIMSFVYSKNPPFGFAMIGIFAVGDGFSTIIGRRYGKNKIPWNGRKSWEGLLGFFASSSLIAYVFLGFPALAYAFLLAIVETLDLNIDDNLLIPLFSVVLFQVFG